jgi:hypothetical protein
VAARLRARSRRALAKYEPDALDLLDQITPPSAPNDSLEDI